MLLAEPGLAAVTGGGVPDAAKDRREHQTGTTISRDC